MLKLLVLGLACWLSVGNSCFGAPAGDAASDRLAVPAAAGQTLKALPAKVDLTKIFDYYCALATMETKVFGASFTDDSIEVRLARLEFKVFKKTSPELSFFDRTERLRVATGDKSVEPEMLRGKFPFSAVPDEPSLLPADKLVLPRFLRQPMTTGAKQLAGRLARQSIRRGVKMAVRLPSSGKMTMAFRMAGVAGNLAALAIMSARASGWGGCGRP